MPSLVWIHFKTLNEIHAECKYCGAILNVTNGSTKGLWTHVSRKHTQEHLSYNYETEETDKTMQELVEKKRKSEETGDPQSTDDTTGKIETPIVASTSKLKEVYTKPVITKSSVGVILKAQLKASTSKALEKVPEPEPETQKEEPEPVLFVKKEIVEDDSSDDEDHMEIDETTDEEKAEQALRWREQLKQNGYALAPDMDQPGNEPTPSLSLPALNEAFRATVSRNYEKAISIVREVVKSDACFMADDLELMDHVFACILNTSHYDETMIEVCWEWIDAFERTPRAMDMRVINGSQLSIYFAYHTICRVQERMPRKPNYLDARRKAWIRIVESFEYLWMCGSALWKPCELDLLDIIVNWSYLALQYADVCDDDTIVKFKEVKEDSLKSMSNTVLVENGHQASERVSTLERNVQDICTRRGTPLSKLMERCGNTVPEPCDKKPRMVEG